MGDLSKGVANTLIPPKNYTKKKYTLFGVAADSMEWLIEGKAYSQWMFWLFAQPLPPSPVSKLDWRQSGRLRKRGQLADWGGGKGWAGSPIKRQQESLVLYKSFNTRWAAVSLVSKYLFFHYFVVGGKPFLEVQRYRPGDTYQTPQVKIINRIFFIAFLFR